MKKIIFLIIVTLFSINVIYSSPVSLNSFENESSLNFLYFYNNYNFNTTKIAFEVSYVSGNIDKKDYFQLETYYSKNISDQDKLIKTNCIQKLDNPEQISYRKITCQIPKVVPGKFTYIGKIIKGSDSKKEVIYSKIISKYYSPEFNSTLDFKYLGNNKTQIIIKINKNVSNLKVFSYIPKSIINSLTPKNKNSLIKSEKDFEIINKDPLIAWNVEKAPVTIKYTINKKISSKDRARFNIQVTKDTPEFNYFKYLIIFLTLLLLISILKPILFKKK